MPLQNRVTPFGEIVATPERGTLFGIRGGRIHDPVTRTLLKRRFTSRRWICCELQFKGRKHEVFGHGYTALFFLDEATAFAAGHRPCFECRRADALRFREAFARGNGLKSLPLADEMDLRLHAERLAPSVREVDRSRLPDGAMVAREGKPCLVLGAELLVWTHSGYLPLTDQRKLPLLLLTPPSTVAALGAGFRARLHPTAVGLTEPRAGPRAR
ncbi:hypothetical protein SAMN05444161_5188 [Rhizobiales bacterium GAS191]|nr:hypothetical protein SAMN05519103_04453 [Rhizobiales bacterium GAS113]SEE23004.1 hypothetical protein SAMN05444161_5188 [Rhizobiales bacterium GAS191]